MPVRPPILRFNRETVVLVLCLAVAATLLALPLDSRIAVASWLDEVFVKPWTEQTGGAKNTGDQDRKYVTMEERILDLEQQLAVANRMATDAPRLSGPAFEAALFGDLVPCRVVMRVRQRYVTMLKIESLEDAAWAQWQPVISRRGYLGRIRDVVNAREAWVELMTAPDFALGVQVRRSNLLGILMPRSGRFLVEYVGPDEDVQVGDEIVTSGIVEAEYWNRLEPDMPAVTPPHIPVGVVSELPEPAMGQIFKTIVVKPYAQFTHNEFVYVVTPLPPAGAAAR